jgi:hypothetical protein
MYVPPSKKPKNRYEAEPTPGKKERPPEVRPDLEQVQAEKGERLPIDAAYAGTVSGYFNEKRRMAELTEAGDTEYFNNEAFLAAEQEGLEKLANPETAGKMEPKDVAMPLGDLAGAMSARNPESPANRTGDAAADAASQKEHDQTKKVFMESAAKIFPNVKIDKDDLGFELAQTSEKMSLVADAYYVPDARPEDLRQMLEKDPEKLAGKLDGILAKTGELMQVRAKMNFDVNDEQKREEMNAHLAAGAEMYYKLQLLRDALREKQYGRKDIPVHEQEQVDTMRAAFGAKEAAEKDAKEEELTSEQKQMLERAGALSNDSPALAEMRKLWKNDSAFANRLNALADKAEMMVKEKQKASPDVGREMAARKTMRETYGDLLPAERKVLEDAAKRETSDESADVKKKTTGEGLFIEMMTRLQKGSDTTAGKDDHAHPKS